MPGRSVLRIAMWSGPRNVSTALMRSWGNRPDTWVCDEPLYAHYLQATGRDHPGAAEVIARGPTDWQVAVDRLLGDVPGGRPIFYQKHMAHHLLPHVGRGWLDRLAHAFLIREPRAMLISLIKNVPDADLADTGLPQQWEIFEHVRRRTGQVPPVVDSRDLLDDPPRLLRHLCAALGVEFLPAMLSWPPGRRETDGVWAPYWYEQVERSTTFRPFQPKNEPLPPAFAGLLAQCQEIYDRLAAFRLGAD